MWFRNLSVFQSSQPFDWSPVKLDEMLSRAHCPAITQQALSVDGFVAPVKGDERMVHEVNGLILATYQETARLLPGAVIKEELDERIQQIEAQEGRKPGRKERADLKDQITFELMPKAFTRSRRIPFLIDMMRHRIIIDGSGSRAEQVVATLRKAVGDLPVKPPGAEHAPAAAMTAWLRNPAILPAGLTLGDRCELKADSDAGASVRFTAMDLGCDEILAHLDTGMAVVKLNLCWNDACEFDLSDTLEIKRLRPLDMLRENIDAIDEEDVLAELLAHISLQGGLMREILDRLYTFFGDESQAPTPAPAR